MKALFVMVFLVLVQGIYAQQYKENNRSFYPVFLGIKGQADSIVIKKFIPAPRKFGDSLSVKNIAETSFFYFDGNGLVTEFRKYGRKSSSLLEKTFYERKDNRIYQIQSTIYKDNTPEKRLRRLLKYNPNEELWIETYSDSKKHPLRDSIFIKYHDDNTRTEEKKSSSGSLSKETYTYNKGGLPLSRKIISDKTNISATYWDYDERNLLISSLSGAYFSNGGSMAVYTFFKNTTDERGNWIERRCYNKDGRLLYIEEQTIYYRN